MIEYDLFVAEGSVRARKGFGGRRLSASRPSASLPPPSKQLIEIATRHSNRPTATGGQRRQ